MKAANLDFDEAMAAQEGAPFHHLHDEPESSRNLQLIAASSFGAVEPHKRDWIVDGWLPAGAATCFFGDGGLGKSLITQQLATCVATGLPFYDLIVERGTVLMVTCEDDANELNWRQRAINKQLGIEMGKLEPLLIDVRLGKDSALVTFAIDGRLSYTPLLDDLRKIATARCVKLLTIDNVMHVYPDNVNDPGRVTRFVSALSGLAQDVGCAVLLVGHIAKQAGSQFAGTAAWNNAARSRWFLDRPKDGEGNPLNPDWRILTKGKANYSSSGDVIQLEFADGAFSKASFDLPTAAAKGPRLTDQQRITLELLATLTSDAGEHSSEALAAGCPAYTKAVSIDTWRDAYKNKFRDGGGEAESERLKKAFQRDRKRLAAVGKVGFGGDFAWAL